MALAPSVQRWSPVAIIRVGRSAPGVGGGGFIWLPPGEMRCISESCRRRRLRENADAVHVEPVGEGLAPPALLVKSPAIPVGTGVLDGPFRGRGKDHLKRWGWHKESACPTMADHPLKLAFGKFLRVSNLFPFPTPHPQSPWLSPKFKFHPSPHIKSAAMHRENSRCSARRAAPLFLFSFPLRRKYLRRLCEHPPDDVSAVP